MVEEIGRRARVLACRGFERRPEPLGEQILGHAGTRALQEIYAFAAATKASGVMSSSCITVSPGAEIPKRSMAIT